MGGVGLRYMLEIKALLPWGGFDLLEYFHCPLPRASPPPLPQKKPPPQHTEGFSTYSYSFLGTLTAFTLHPVRMGLNNKVSKHMGTPKKKFLKKSNRHFFFFKFFSCDTTPRTGGERGELGNFDFDFFKVYLQ